MTPSLSASFERSASVHPERIAVVDPARGASIEYRELEGVSGRLAEALVELGAGPGQRVGLYAPKSIPAVAAVLATLRTGAAYVPVDATAPARRGAEILDDCGVCAVVVERGLAARLCEAWDREPQLHNLPLPTHLGADLALLPCRESEPAPVDGLSYVLYTSGSTGKPKGVMHTHASAGAFVAWCRNVFQPVPEDRFSSHAPLHFDLSILDLFVPLSSGAAVVLIGEEEGKNPLRLAPLIAESGISVWYSTPSVLRLLVEHGGLDSCRPGRLRLVLFAGEVFPPGHLRRLQRAWPGRKMWNLYGPTETNVCTAYEIEEEVPEDRTLPYPIGKPIDGDATRVLDGEGRDVAPGEEGELVVRGGTVMAGYWNRPDLDERAFLGDPDGARWYRTGDLVHEDGNRDYVFLGRRDRMVKRRGYRVELGEIEAALYRHPDVVEAAVVAVPDPDGVRIEAFLRHAGGGPGSTIAMKRFCAENLPLYMVPDRFRFLDELPKTSTDKIDYQRLQHA